jgi:predicted Zn-ribbon and HTH transcriptional regulator
VINFGKDGIMTNEMICPFCGYEWEKRVDNPKSCSRCKRRLDMTWKTKKSDKK